MAIRTEHHDISGLCPFTWGKLGHILGVMPLNEIFSPVPKMILEVLIAYFTVKATIFADKQRFCLFHDLGISLSYHMLFVISFSF